ncbi:hypothetical protein [Clostridium tyrobutyricum]|uniref:hypothetical protein n=1 Tax=Clostridium tyrobutyricum TaxID=1519 RepID=UPI00126A34F5|nr:hypothetical protein [Clostridium tyrobutyricum]
MKMAKCIIELERIYGSHQGNGSNQYIKKADRNNFAQQKTQEDLAKQLGIDERQLQNYKKLTRLIPELQSMVEHDALKSTTAYKILIKLLDPNNSLEAKQLNNRGEILWKM